MNPANLHGVGNCRGYASLPGASSLRGFVCVLTKLTIYGLSILSVACTTNIRSCTGSHDHAESLVASQSMSVGLYSVPTPLSIYHIEKISLYRMLGPVHLSLVINDGKNHVYGSAATSWQIIDGTEYRFTLDTSLQFHDGKNLSCVDVVHTFSQLMSTLDPQRFHIRNIKDYYCLNAGQFVVRLHQPSSGFLPWLHLLERSIIPADHKSMPEQTIGLGPYRLVKGENTTLPTLERVQSHPSLRPWSLHRIHFHHFSTTEESFAAFRRGTVDLVPLFSFPTGEERQWIVSPETYNRLWFLQLGLRSGLLHNTSIRKSVYDKIDRNLLMAQDINRRSFFTPSFGVVPPHLIAYSAPSPHAQTPARSPCYQGGRIYTLITRLAPESLVQSVMQQLQQMGFAIELRPTTREDFYHAVQSFEFDFALYSFGLLGRPEDDFRNFYTSESRFPKLPQLPKTIEDEIAMLTVSTTESDRTRTIISFEERRREDALFIPLLFQKHAFLLNPCLKIVNYDDYDSGNPHYEGIARIASCLWKGVSNGQPVAQKAK
jgi:MarR-like DNA-binding transcriptional regulator SgrR of sgrS sRNA